MTDLDPSLHPGVDDFWFLPLGGCGEIGMNLNLYGHDGRWLMVDCGVTFENMPGSDRSVVQMPDPAFIAARRDSLVGIVATHAHEDHIGALPWLWDQFQCPIYTTPFTASILTRKLRQVRSNAPVITVGIDRPLSLAPFNIRWMPITHSTPETHALLIETPAGRVLHTADWKIDHDPVTEAGFNDNAFAELAGIDTIVCDSTNATQPGHSVSEGALMDGLRAEAESATGRLIVACFASNIARLQTLGRVAVATDRYIAVYGRSLENFVTSARACGYLQQDFPLINQRHTGYLPPHEVLALVTGSQGEAGSALHRLAMGTHPDLALDPHDKVVFSARSIPGNEARLQRVMNGMTETGVTVVHADRTNALLHASGHPAVDELHQMYRWVKPTLAIPVHGEAAHMAANAAVARDAGVPSTLTGSNGDLFVLGSRPRLRKRAVAAGRLEVTPNGRGTVRVD